MSRPRTLWTVVSILLLAIWLFVIALGTRTPEALFLPLAVMGLLSFPLGPLAAIVVILLAEAVSFHIEDSFDDPMMAVLWIWIFLYGWGYLQWFVLVPALRRRGRGARRD